MKPLGQPDIAHPKETFSILNHSLFSFSNIKGEVSAARGESNV